LVKLGDNDDEITRCREIQSVMLLGAKISIRSCAALAATANVRHFSEKSSKKIKHFMCISQLTSDELMKLIDEVFVHLITP